MRDLLPTDILQLADAARFPRHLTAGLRPRSVLGWEYAELVGLFTRSGYEGLLIFESGDDYYPMHFRFGRAVTLSGRQRSVLCDICITQHDRGGLMTIPVLDGSGRHTGRRLGRYCCGDLLCSQHAQGFTAESRKSRQAFPETITASRKIERIQTNVFRLINAADVTPISL